jgi:tetrahydromethanopterin S-methyltransferase subunit C
MYKLFVFCCLLHYVLRKDVDTHDFVAVFGIWHHLRLLCLGSQELRNAPGILTMYSVSLPTIFFFMNEDVLISVLISAAVWHQAFNKLSSVTATDSKDRVS